jgi:hypothetical protein
MEWEYLQGVILGDLLTTRVPVLIMTGPENQHTMRVPFAKLGLNGWELITVVAFEGELVAFFKRQKLYPMGAAPLEPAF